MNPEQFCEYVIDNYSVKLKGQTKLSIDGEVISRSKIREFFIQNPTDDDEFNSKLIGKEATSFFAHVEEKIEYVIKDRKKKKYSSENTISIDQSEGYETVLKNYRPLRDVKTGKMYLYSITEKQLAELDMTIWEDLPKDLREGFPPINCIAKYQPYKLYTSKEGVYYPAVKKEIKLPVLYVNQHIPPNWRLNSDVSAQCPPRIARFLEHLFPDVECRKFFLNWVRNAIISRNNTNLVLNSAKGTGKNILVEQGIKNLVGERNFSKAHRAFFTSKFNSILLNKRIILIDEHRIDTPDKQDMVKDYSNPFQNVEQKGKDADDLVETFHSFIILNNRETDIKIEQDDRRYAVMDVTDTRLLDVFNEEEIQELIEEFKDHDSLSQFGHWILEKCDFGHTTESLYKGKKWHRLIEVSLWEWQKFVLDTILTMEEKEYDIESLKARYKRVRTSNKSNLTKDLVQDFLKNYKHEGNYLGKVEKVNGAWVIIPNKRYLPDWAKKSKRYKVEL